MHVKSPNLTFDGLAIDAARAVLDGGDGAVLEMGDAHHGTFKNGSVGNVIDQKGAIMSGDFMTIDNVVFHDVFQQAEGVHSECLFIMVPDYLVMRNSIFKNCNTMDVNMSWPDYWQPPPPAYGHVTLENNVFGHSTDGSGWHHYGLAIFATGPNEGVPPCARGPRAATYLDGWVVRHNTFENAVLVEGCGINSRWVGNLGGGWDCLQGVTFRYNVGEDCSPLDFEVNPASSCAPPACTPAQWAPYDWRDPPLWDFHLTATSIPIDKGDPDDHPPTDRDGNTRVGPPDAGAYEYVP
jgi:hypothetical protein